MTTQFQSRTYHLY